MNSERSTYTFNALPKDEDFSVMLGFLRPYFGQHNREERENETSKEEERRKGGKKERKERKEENEKLSCICIFKN